MAPVLIRHRIVEDVRPGMRLGRHIHHDPQSLAYRVPVPARAPKTIKWARHGAPLNQGNLGSCTGNAKTGSLLTDPFYATIRAAFPDLAIDEKLAVDLYSIATTLDPYDGAYPPNDTGSDGLSVNKAAVQCGYESGYTHALSVADVIGGLQSGPGETGVNWYSSFDNPSNEGIVRISSTARVRGGHEFETFGVDLERELLACWQSWGPAWGVGGMFFIPLSDYERLLHEDGDATFGVPLDAPAPVPEPVPTPQPGVTVTFTDDQAATMAEWALSPHGWGKATRAAKVYRAEAHV